MITRKIDLLTCLKREGVSKAETVDGIIKEKVPDLIHLNFHMEDKTKQKET